MNSFVSLQLRAISLAGSARLRGLIFQRLGKGIEQYVLRLVTGMAERAGAEVAVNHGIRMFGKRALIDVMIKFESRIIYPSKTPSFAIELEPLV